MGAVPETSRCRSTDGATDWGRMDWLSLQHHLGQRVMLSYSYTLCMGKTKGPQDHNQTFKHTDTLVKGLTLFHESLEESSENLVALSESEGEQHDIGGGDQ